jgi:hypothetical protein
MIAVAITAQRLAAVEGQTRMIWIVKLSALLVIVAFAYTSIGGMVTFLVVTKRPDLFSYCNEFFVQLALIIPIIWPITLLAIMGTLAIKPVRDAWEKKLN